MACAPDTRAALAAAAAIALGFGAAAGALPAAADVASGHASALPPAAAERVTAVYAGYYAQPPEVVARLLRVGLSADDVSVTLWLATTAAADPYAIAASRVKTGMSWPELFRAYRVPTWRLAVRLDRPGAAQSPYARAYRVLAGRAPGPLRDGEVRDLVQLRLLSEYYRLRPSRVIARRAGGHPALDLILEADRASGARPAGHALGRRP